MSSTLSGKPVAQLYPSAAVLTTLYTVTDNPSINLTSLIVCNHSGTNDSFRFAIAIAGEADANKQYIYYDMVVAANDSLRVELSINVLLNTAIRIYATNGTLSFSLFGVP